MSDLRHDEQPHRRRREVLVVGFSALAVVALVIVVVMGVGLHRAKTAAVPAQPSMPAESPLPSFYPPAIQSPVDGHIGAIYATEILTYTPYVDGSPQPGIVITSTDSSMDSTTDPSTDCTAVTPGCST